jgi:GT2 family glycosyltransferase
LIVLQQLWKQKVFNLAENSSLGVTVVVPTLNRGAYLPDCLQDLLAQEHRPLEILVVDQSAEVPEPVQHIVDANQDVISYHRVGFRGLPLARNYGWRNARYDAIVYVDDDIRCPPNLVSEHLRALRLPKVGVVAGHITEVNRDDRLTGRAGRFNKWTAHIERNFSSIGEYDADHVPGGNFAVWRDVFQRVGGIEEKLNYGAALYEETEFCLRAKGAGYRIYFNSNAHLDHLASPTGGCRVDQVQSYMWALAHNRTILIRRHLKWYQQPVAFAEVLRLGLAYSVHYRQPRAFSATIGGIRAGWKDA